MRLCCIAGLAFLLLAQTVSAVEILRVQPDRLIFDPHKGETWKLRFHLSSAATVTLNLYDERDHQVRAVQSKDRLPPGDQALTWDGRNTQGHIVAAEAYHYTLQARGSDGVAVVYDITDLTGHDDITVRAVHWLPDKHTIQYQLPKAARVKLRVGLQDKGPYLGTLVDWAPRPAGLNTEHWDGKDASGMMDLTHHPKFDIVAMAYALSDNTVIVGPPVARPALPTAVAHPVVRTPTREFKPKIYAPYLLSFDTRGDFAALLRLPGRVPHNKQGMPVVSGVVPLRFDAEALRRAEVLSRRIEAVFFVDGLYTFEAETGFIPMTMNWDARHVNPGVHYLTVNLRGYLGNFGVATLRVYVEPEATNLSTTDAKH